MPMLGYSQKTHTAAIGLVLSVPCGFHSLLKYALIQVLMGRPRDEWRSEVSARYRALEQFSKEDARLQFLRILRSLPYGEPMAPTFVTICKMVPSQAIAPLVHVKDTAFEMRPAAGLVRKM